MLHSAQLELPDWILSLCVSLKTDSLFASTSKGTLHQLPLDATKWSSISTTSTSSNMNAAHTGPIHKILTDPFSPTTLYSCSDDSTVKVWDVRTPSLSTSHAVHTLTNSRNLPFFSMDINHGLISAGSQLKGVDSELVLWDTRKLDQSLRSFIDSHNDDITETKFHPTRKNVLLSGGTDGYVNIYDLNIIDEDDAQLQCINYASVHSAGFTTNDRIYVLSHMETFAMFDMSSKEDIDPESATDKTFATTKRGDQDYGDIREKWDCEYVVDLYAPGYVVCGSNSKNVVKIHKFDAEREDFQDLGKNSGWVLEGGHGEEIVRDFAVCNNQIFTAGEDNIVRVWNGEGLNNTQHTFFSSMLEKEEGEVLVDVDTERMDVEYDEGKKKSKEQKEKKHRKHKKDSKSKKHRFKPY